MISREFREHQRSQIYVGFGIGSKILLLYICTNLNIPGFSFLCLFTPLAFSSFLYCMRFRDE